MGNTFANTHHIHRRSLRPASSKPGLRRPISSVSVDGVLKSDDNENGRRTKRVKVLTPEQRQAIQNLTDPSQMPHEERKRQFGALNRRLKDEATLPAGVLAKWECAKTQSQKPGTKFFLSLATYRFNFCQIISLLSDSPTPRFEFLKCFMLDSSLSNVKVETWHKESGPQNFPSFRFINRFLSICAPGKALPRTKRNTSSCRLMN